MLMPQRISIVAFIAAALAGGCTITPSESRADMTFTDLFFVGDAMERLTWEECKSADSVEDFFKLIEDKKILERDRRKDGWGNPYRGYVRRSEDEIVITVISCGQNGQYEQGRGDDLSCEVHIKKSGSNTHRRRANR
jgi:hypothetical protein